MKTRLFLSLIVVSIMIAPLTTNPTAQADTLSSPVPVPGNLFPIPIPGTVSPLPSIPNLGTVPVLPPLGSLYTISKTQSGLAAYDPLNNETKTQQELLANQQYWKYGGDAIARNAPYTFSKDNQGLHIGVQAPANGAWAGVYAVTPNTNAMLFHTVVSTPLRVLPTLAQPQWYENGMYVQTAGSPDVNYITCTSATSQWGTTWGIISTLGTVNQANTFSTLYLDTSANQPLTRDCTIITNGNNYLKVYLDGVKVYENSTLNLQMPAPFNVFEEPQSSYAGQLLNGTYADYYATTSEIVKVTNAPSLASTIDLVDPTGKVLATSPVTSGTATFTIGQFHMPLAAYIKMYDSHNIQLASTSSPVNIFGGDVYTVSAILGL
ncbi:exported protein of unknown function [Nitrosotalea devaniterrae]|uniref:Uncharacterized protein n=1 Tax=Nitrosotalea devaniterrae TaxID=1078905 RepID=A0A128A4J8_9ARCH|nr:exported protein of unknown function [Candidatus Nitrosotalea devanaterra]